MHISSSLYTIPLLFLAAVSAAEEVTHVPTAIGDDIIVFLSQERGIGNCVAILGEDGVLVVDSALPTSAKSIVARIREVTDQPVRYLINTHWHDDHIWGNQAYVDAFPHIEIISHASTRKDILETAIPNLAKNIEQIEAAIASKELQLQQGAANEEELLKRLDPFRAVLADFKQIRPQVPSVTVDEGLVIHLGELEVHVLRPGRGHTRGDLVVHVPARDLLITGDLLTHPIPAAAEAFPVDWVETLTVLDALEFSTLVPGHGPVLEDRVYFRDVSDLLRALVAQVKTAIREGRSLEQIQGLVDVEEFKSRLTGGDPIVARAFDRFFLQPAIEATFSQFSSSASPAAESP